MNNLWDLLPCFKNKEDEISFDPISYPDLEPKQTAEPVFPLKEIKIIKQYHSNGNLRRKYTLIGNLKEGPCLEWYESGVLAYQYSFKNNKKDGLYYGWWENGIPGFRKHYKNGYLDGLQFYYSEEGRLYSIEKCSMGAVLFEKIR
jgi:hypothetical protein